MYSQDKEEWAGNSSTDHASTKIKAQSISLKTATFQSEREMGVRWGGWGRSGAEGRIPKQHVCGLKGKGVCACARMCWGPCHLSAPAERRPGLESGSCTGMCVLPSEGEERGEGSGPTNREGFINRNSCTHV